jgi:FkbM family methyltransferase
MPQNVFFDAMPLGQLLADELSRMIRYKPADRVDMEPAQFIDLLFAYRLMLGRWPEFDSLEHFRTQLGKRNVAHLAHDFVQSAEFKSRFAEDAGYDLNIMVESPDQFRFWFNWRDRQALRIVTGIHEPTTQEIMRQVLRPGMNCLDVGAHIGLYTLFMARCVGKKGKVYAFEPFPATYALLEKNVEENRCGDSVKLFRLACSDRKAKARIFAPLDDDLGTTYVPIRDDLEVTKGLTGQEIETTLVDNLIPEQDRIGLIKMDIEGCEPRALRGMHKIVSRDRPFILTEFNSYCLQHMSEADPADYLRQLRDHGYRIYEHTVYLADRNREFTYEGDTATVNLACVPH